MPKDRTENIDRYKVRGGQFNDYQKQKDEIALTHPEGFEHGQREDVWPKASTPQGERETEAERIRRLMEEAREIAQRKKLKAAGKTKKTSAGKTAAKSATKKLATRGKQSSSAGRSKGTTKKKSSSVKRSGTSAVARKSRATKKS